MLLSIILRRSSIVAAADKCFMFRKRMHLKWFMGIQTVKLLHKKLHEESWILIQAQTFFTSSLLWCKTVLSQQHPKEKIQAPTFLCSGTYFPLCRFPVSGSATLLWSHPDFCWAVVGLTPCRGLSWEGLLQTTQGWNPLPPFHTVHVGANTSASAMIQFNRIQNKFWISLKM